MLWERGRAGHSSLLFGDLSEILAGQKVDQMPGGALGLLSMGLSQGPGARLHPGGEFNEQSLPRAGVVFLSHD